MVGGEDFTLRGGSPNASGLRKSVYVEDLALKLQLPLVRFHEGGGGSVTGAGRRGPVGEPVLSRNRFISMARTLETAPVAAVAIGAVAGMPAARLCAAHFSVMTRNSQVLVGGPALVERAVGERVSKEALGGPDVHLPNGVVHNLADDEADAFAQVRTFLGYLPPNVWELPPAAPCADDPGRTEEALLDLVPRDRRKPFDMRRLIRLVLDGGSWFEMARRFGPGQITGLARLAGHPVGVLGNDGRHYAGAMTAEGAQKVRRFAELCDQFHLPVVSFVDEPGFMIGRDAERAGTIRHGTEAIMAVMRTRVPWVSVMVRKSYGVAAARPLRPLRDGVLLALGGAGGASARGRGGRRLRARDRGGGRPRGEAARARDGPRREAVAVPAGGVVRGAGAARPPRDPARARRVAGARAPEPPLAAPARPSRALAPVKHGRVLAGASAPPRPARIRSRGLNFPRPNLLGRSAARSMAGRAGRGRRCAASGRGDLLMVEWGSVTER